GPHCPRTHRYQVLPASTRRPTPFSSVAGGQQRGHRHCPQHQERRAFLAWTVRWRSAEHLHEKEGISCSPRSMIKVSIRALKLRGCHSLAETTSVWYSRARQHLTSASPNPARPSFQCTSIAAALKNQRASDKRLRTAVVGGRTEPQPICSAHLGD